MGAENFELSSSSGSVVENKENDQLTFEVKEDLNTVTTGVESNPTVEGIKDAIRDFAVAIQEENNAEARATMLRLRAYASADIRMRRGIEAAIGNMSIGGVSLTQKIAAITDIEGLNHTPDPLKYAMMLYLNLQGYYLTDKKFDTLPLYNAVQEYRMFVTTRDTYTTKYALSASEATEKATFAYPSLEELATDYELLSSSSRGALDGWLRAAGQAPVVQKLYAQQAPITNIRDILDKDTTNDLQEQMFVYLYKSVQQRATELADEAVAQHQESEFHKAQATAPEGTTYAKTTLDSVTVSASGSKKLPSLQGDIAQGKQLITQPGAGYSDAILAHVNALIEQRNTVPETKDLEGQLAQLGVAIDRLVTAADAADPEKTGEGIDQYLVYSIESQLSQLESGVIKTQNEELKQSFYTVVEQYIDSFLLVHSDAHIQRHYALTFLPAEKKLQKIEQLTKKQRMPTNGGSTDIYSSLGLGTPGNINWFEDVNNLNSDLSFPDVTQFETVITNAESGLQNLPVNTLMNYRSTIANNLLQISSFTGSRGLINPFTDKSIVPGNYQIIHSKTEEEKNDDLLPQQLATYTQRVGTEQQNFDNSNVLKKTFGYAVNLISFEGIQKDTDPRVLYLASLDKIISEKLATEYVKADPQEKENLKEVIFNYCEQVTDSAYDSEITSLQNWQTPQQLLGFVVDDMVQVDETVESPTKDNINDIVTMLFSGAPVTYDEMQNKTIAGILPTLSTTPQLTTLLTESGIDQNVPFSSMDTWAQVYVLSILCAQSVNNAKNMFMNSMAFVGESLKILMMGNGQIKWKEDLTKTDYAIAGLYAKSRNEPIPVMKGQVQESGMGWFAAGIVASMLLGRLKFVKNLGTKAKSFFSRISSRFRTGGTTAAGGVVMTEAKQIFKNVMTAQIGRHGKVWMYSAWGFGALANAYGQTLEGVGEKEGFGSVSMKIVSLIGTPGSVVMGLLDGIGLTDPFLNKSDKKPDDLDNLEPEVTGGEEKVEVTDIRRVNLDIHATSNLKHEYTGITMEREKGVIGGLADGLFDLFTSDPENSLIDCSYQYTLDVILDGELVVVGDGEYNDRLNAQLVALQETGGKGPIPEGPLELTESLTGNKTLSLTEKPNLTAVLKKNLSTGVEGQSTEEVLGYRLKNGSNILIEFVEGNRSGSAMEKASGEMKAKIITKGHELMLQSLASEQSDKVFEVMRKAEEQYLEKFSVIGYICNDLGIVYNPADFGIGTMSVSSKFGKDGNYSVEIDPKKVEENMPKSGGDNGLPKSPPKMLD